MRIARHRVRAYYQALPVRRRYRHLHAIKFIGLARLAFREAFHFGRVQGIELVLVLRLLLQKTLRAANQVFQRSANLLRHSIQLPFDV